MMYDFIEAVHTGHYILHSAVTLKIDTIGYGIGLAITHLHNICS